MDPNQQSDKTGVIIPDDYIQNRQGNKEEEIEIFFKVDNWLFWDLESCKEQTLILRKEGNIGKNDFAFAINEEDQILFYKSFENTEARIFHLDEDKDATYYAFSLTEFHNFEETQRLIEEIETVGFENQDLTDILNCTGSLFNYAYELNTSEYDEHFSEKRNQRALELFLKTAASGHPEAAKEVADHYYFQENPDVTQVIKWREKAIELGSKEDVYELADFIIDEKPDEAKRAITLLESLLAEPWYKVRAMLKLSQIYMRGTGVRPDYDKGIEYVKKCVEAGDYTALSDLAFYHYKGMGVEKNVRKAYELLVEAENGVRLKTGLGMWGSFIEQLEKELKISK